MLVCKEKRHAHNMHVRDVYISAAMCAYIYAYVYVYTNMFTYTHQFLENLLLAAMLTDM